MPNKRNKSLDEKLNIQASEEEYKRHFELLERKNIIEYKDWLFVTVKPGWTDLKVHGDMLLYRIQGLASPGAHSYCINLPKGSYQIIGKGDKVGDTIWYGIVDKQDYRKGNYNDYWFMDYVTNEYSLQDATSSGYSLVRSLGMEPEECLVLKKNEK